MGIFIGIVILGIILLVFGVAIEAAKILIYIGIAVILIGAIAALIRYIRSRA
ncbi:MAG: hypothetical protein JWQ19_825 [Subtercola sp.]|uniref:hypothetical protein n=1 Tax=Subtercola endophyticus TaxID=2895559 RepID=UPI001E2F4BC1|nr:hypothetical protein [Subtercola endophyticus]MCU1480039.1 hypothetical protein [Subtercola sp.]UFS59973.1 hypothetical protein LQ955_04095 [Subtercola endophyticus]